jgi:hypothetical protein
MKRHLRRFFEPYPGHSGRGRTGATVLYPPILV